MDFSAGVKFLRPTVYPVEAAALWMQGDSLDQSANPWLWMIRLQKHLALNVIIAQFLCVESSDLQCAHDKWVGYCP